MNAKIKEALAALTTIEDLGTRRTTHIIRLATIRSALEAAQQEAEAWEVIEKWGRGKDVARRDLVLMPCGIGYFWETRSGCKIVGESIAHLPSRAEALKDAAAWCRAELAK